MDMIRLDKYCESVRDGTHDTPKPTADGKYLITSKAINNDTIDYSSAYYISEKDFNMVNKRSKVDKYDVLMTMIGSVGRLHLVDYEPDYAIKNIALFKIGDYYKAKWLYYYMSSNNVQNYLEAVANGTSQHFVGLGYLRKFKIEDINEDKKRIVDILTNYDNLIKFNNKRIAILEQIAEEIYKEWFVRFRFPGYKKIEKKETRIGRIPSTFDVKNIGDVLDYYIGGGWGNDDFSEDYSESAYVIRGTDFENARKVDISSIPYRYHKKSNVKTRMLQENDLIIEISGGTQEQPVGRTIIVTKDLLGSMKDNCICASFCKLIRCNKNISPIYFQYWMKYLYDTRIIDRYQLQSTGIINFKFEYFTKKGFVVVPSEEIISKFEKIIIPIQEEIGKLGKENQNLIKQRDLLMPRLMSGKLEVK